MSNARPETILRHVRQLALAPHTQALSDTQLLENFRATRDEAAFTALMQRHGGLVWSVCRQVLGHTQDAEDAFQAVFLALARQAELIRKSQAVASWLHGTAYRAALRAKRDATRRRLHEGRAKQASEQPGPCEGAWRELQSALDEEVQRLPQRQRAVFVLCVLEGKSQEEAATALGWKAGTVSGTLARSRQRLRARLARRGIELPAPLVGLALTDRAAVAAPALAVATLRVALGDAEVSPQVAALLKAGTTALLSTKLKALTALLLALALAATALAWRAAPPTAGSVGKPPEKAKVSLDAQGDPLPPGAVGRLGTLRFRHADSVGAFALSPDGKTLAGAGGRDLVLWDAVTGKELRRLEGSVGILHALAFTPDGRFIAWGTEDNTIRVWDVAKGAQRRRFQHPPGAGRGVYGLAFTSDGNTLVSRGVDGICLWQVATGKEVRRIGGAFRAGLPTLALSPDGKTIAAALWDYKNGEVGLWETDTGKEVRRLPLGAGLPSCVAFSSDGKMLVAGVRHKPERLVLWEVGRWRKLRTLKGPTLEAACVAFSPDGKTLASGGADGTARLWDVKTAKELATLRPARPAEYPPWLDELRGVAFSPDGKTLVTKMGGLGIEGGNTLRFWDVVTRKEVRCLSGHRGDVRALAFSADGKTLVTGSADSTVGVWDVGRRSLRRVLAHRGSVTAVALSPRRATVSAMTGGGHVYSWDARTGKELRGFDTKAGGAGMAFAPGGRVLASWDRLARSSRAVRLWAVGAGKELRRLESAPTSVNVGAFSPDGRLLALGSSEEPDFLTIWEVKTGRLLRRVVGGNAVLSLAFSPDGRMLASGHAEQRVRIWEVATGGLRLSFDHESPMVLAFSPDGGLLASAGSLVEGKLTLWSTFNGRRLHTLAGHRGRVASLAFSPDGRLLASGSNDTTALLWGAGKLPRGPRLHPKGVGEKDVEARWEVMNGADAAKAYRSMQELLASPRPTVARFGKRMRLVAVEPGRAAKLLADLDSDDLATRQKASQQLAQLGPAVEPALRQALAGRPPLEARRRIENLLRGLERQSVGLLRGIEVLEWLNTAEARELLRVLAAGERKARLTQEAKEALARLSRRRPSP
jgi:RNA polymerase sigma factor (sigma-70 family)